MEALTKQQLYITTVSAYALGCLCVKLSIGLGYLRILRFRHLDTRWERLVCYAVIVVSCVINLQYFFHCLFLCASKGIGPTHVAPAVIAGKCALANRAVYINTYVQTTVNVIIDWVLVLLPIPSVLGVIMDKKTRVSLIVILILGGG
jgi:hypothetical protein